MRTPLLFLFFCFTISICLAQKDSVQVMRDSSSIEVKEITEHYLKIYKLDSKFDYTVAKKESTWWDGVKNWLYNVVRKIFEWLFGIEKGVGFLVNFLKIIPYLLLGLLLFLVIRFFIRSNTTAILHGKKNKNLVSLSEEERIIKTEDILLLIEEAVSKQNYRLAIRYYYLHILKLLSEKDLIEWQQQKTNDDYLTELNTTTFKPQFKNITRWYDHVWYGEFPITKERYNKAESVFKHLQNSIHKV